MSFEHEIESRKTEYYRVLRSCQAQRPNEDVTEWIRFFFDALGNIQHQLMIKLESKGVETRLSPREKAEKSTIKSISLSSLKDSWRTDPNTKSSETLYL